MTNSYTNNVGYNVTTKKPEFIGNNSEAASLAISAGIIGAGIGATAQAIKKTPVVNSDGVATDTFVKTVYKKYVKRTKDEEVKLFEKQRQDIMKKIGNVSDAEGLKNLLNENKELANKILAPSGMDTESYSKSLTKGMKRFFIKKNKRSIQRGVENAYEMRLDDISSKIMECWNATSKKFEKSSEVSEELYKAIKNAKNGIKAKQIVKTAGIAGLITGISTFILFKVYGLIKNKKSVPNNQKMSLNVSY